MLSWAHFGVAAPRWGVAPGHFLSSKVPVYTLYLFSTGVFSYLLIFRSSLCVFGSNLLSVIRTANTLLQCGLCLFTALRVSFLLVLLIVCICFLLFMMGNFKHKTLKSII